jgi:hypothetical protein
MEANLESVQFVEALKHSRDGLHKSASEKATGILRKAVKHEAIFRNILTPVTKTSAELFPDQEHDFGFCREYMETVTHPAMSVPYGDTPISNLYYAKTFDVVFSPIITPENRKSEFELEHLAAQGVDIHKMVVEDQARSIYMQEDLGAFSTIYDACGPVGGVGISGLPQHFELTGGIRRETYPQVLQVLKRNNLNNGTVVMNNITASAFLAWGRDEWGGDTAQELAHEGLSGLQEKKLFGTRHLFTSNREVVPDGRIVLFAPANYLGRFYINKEMTLSVEKRRNYVTSWADEVIGMTLANVYAFAIVDVEIPTL